MDTPRQGLLVFPALAPERRISEQPYRLLGAFGFAPLGEPPVSNRFADMVRPTILLRTSVGGFERFIGVRPVNSLPSTRTLVPPLSKTAVVKSINVLSTILTTSDAVVLCRHTPVPLLELAPQS
jgi:hypothetical protein